MWDRRGVARQGVGPLRVQDAASIRGLELFCDMTEESFATLLRAAFLQRLPAGLTLIRQGEPADFLHVVIEGLVELFATYEGRETTMAMVRPIGTFPLAAVLRDEVCLQSARTLEHSRILMIPSENVREAMDRDPAFARSLVRELADSHREMIKDLKNQKLRTGVERLANWLLRAQRCQGGDTVRLNYEKRILASRLGMTPENLSRAFVALGSVGVEVKGRDIRLHSLADLAHLAKPNPLIDG